MKKNITGSGNPCINLQILFHQLYFKLEAYNNKVQDVQYDG
jgi:hypothetical protein